MSDKAVNKMARQMKMLDDMISSFPSHANELKEIQADIASGQSPLSKPGQQPFRTRPQAGDTPAARKAAGRMKVLEELRTSYPDKAATFLEIEDTLRSGHKKEDEDLEPAQPSAKITGSN